MLKNILTYLKEGTVFNAVEVVNGESLEYHFLSVKKKKNELEILRACSFDSIEPIKSEVEKSSNVFLIINTNSILRKVIESSKLEDLALVNKAFPNLKTDDFYYETLTSGNNSIVSICRKEEVDSILKKISTHIIDISGFSLGLTSINNILPFIKEKKIQLYHTKIGIENSLIHEVEDVKRIESTTYSINGIEVSSQYLLGFSEIIGNVLQSNSSNSNFINENRILKDEFLNKRFFNLFSKGALIGLLGVLLFNFLFFNHYFNQSEKLLQTSEVNNLNKGKLLKLDSLVKIREKMAEDILSASSSKSSFYMDEIVKTLPATLLLSELDYQPLKKQVKEKEIIEFNNNTILISGTSTNSDDFSNWVESLEKYQWTSSVAIMDYDYSNKTSSLFTLQIKLNDE